jgi:hypothetical protein
MHEYLIGWRANEIAFVAGVDQAVGVATTQLRLKSLPPSISSAIPNRLMPNKTVAISISGDFLMVNPLCFVMFIVGGLC